MAAADQKDKMGMAVNFVTIQHKGVLQIAATRPCCIKKTTGQLFLHLLERWKELDLHFLPSGEKIVMLPPLNWRQATVHRTGMRFVKDGFPRLHRTKGPLV